MLFSQQGIWWERPLCCLPPIGNRQLCKGTLIKPRENELSPLGALCVTTCVIGQREGKTRLGGKPYKTNGKQGFWFVQFTWPNKSTAEKRSKTLEKHVFPALAKKKHAFIFHCTNSRPPKHFSCYMVASRL